MKITFNESINQYLIYCSLKKKNSSCDSIKYRINKFILSYFNNKNIYELSTKDYLDWQYYIESFNFKYSYKSVLHYTFSNFLNYCMIYYDLPCNVASKVGNFKNDFITNKGSIWNLEDYNKFISSVDSLMYKSLFDLLFFTGIRKGELLALTWDDIDFDLGSIYISKNLSKSVVNGSHLITTPKTRSSIRNIVIDNVILNELKDLHNYYKSNYIDFSSSWFLFGGRNVISFNTLMRKKNYYCELANIKPITIHQFRHSHACLLFQNAVPIEDVSYRLGHSKLSMTMNVYLKYLPKNEKRVYDTLNSIHLS